MEKNSKKQQNEETTLESENATENVTEAAEGEVKEDVKPEPLISREGLSDEEYIEKLETALGKSVAELKSCTELLKRLQADFDNFRKRNANVSEEMRKFGQTVVIEKLLTVLDNCDLARNYIKDESALMGFNMMEKQLLDALEGFGLSVVEAEGKEFDANFMTAVERVKDEENVNKVVVVLAKGYLLNGKLLRPASVKIGY